MDSPARTGADSPGLEQVVQKLQESLEVSPLLDTTHLVDEPSDVRTVDKNVLSRDRQRQTPGSLQRQISQPSPKTPVKQTTLSEKLDEMLMVQPVSDSDPDSVSLRLLQAQSQERIMRQRLQVYQDAQQRQAQIVQKLQTKLLQYKQRCEALEGQVLVKSSEYEKMRLMLQVSQDETQCQKQTPAINDKSAQLEEEQKRCASLSQVNSLLREQLDQANAVNKGLMESLWTAQEEINLCDKHLSREQEAHSSRLSREQAHVRALWRQATSLRTAFNQLRTFTDRTLSSMQGECATGMQQILLAFMDVNSRASVDGTSSGVEVSALERQLREKLKEAMQLQGRWDAEKVELNSRIIELTETVKTLRSRSSEKDNTIDTMRISLDKLETQGADDKAEMEFLCTEIETFQETLSHICKLVCNEIDNRDLESESTSPSTVHPPSSLRKTTLKAVQTALSSHQRQNQELQECLNAALEEANTLQNRLLEKNSQTKELEQRIQELTTEYQEAKKALQENLRDRESCHCSLELISSPQATEADVSSMLQELDSQRADLEALRASSLVLQRQRDLLNEQREDLEMQLARQRTEAQRGTRSKEEIEGRHSDLHRELVTVREALNQVTLQKDVLEDEKTSLVQALSKMEAENASQEIINSKLLTQEATLRDSIAKMAAQSEGLASDKVELNRLLLQSEGEKVQLDCRRREAEAQRAAAREETMRVQADLMDLMAEKRNLENSICLLQVQSCKQEAEMVVLQEEKAQILEQNLQVSRELDTVSGKFCETQKVLENQTTALETVTSDREQLAREKAAVDVKLCSAERKACGLTHELAVLRRENQSLEKALFESQELSSSLEAERTRIERERHNLCLANEGLTRDASQAREDAECQLAKAEEERSKLEEKLVQVEREALLTHNKRDELHQKQLETERRLMEQQCAERALQWEKAKVQLHTQYEEHQFHSQKELQRMQEEIVTMQQDCNQKLLQAERVKQQELTQMETEKAAIVQKLVGLQKDLTASSMALERIQREGLSRQEQQKNEVARLQSELKAIQTRFEESLNSRECAEKSFSQQVREVTQQNQQAGKELVDLRRQQQETEAKHVKAQKDLIEAQRELRLCKEDYDEQRGEALNLKRLLSDETKEKETLQESNQELRSFIRRTEEENNRLRRAVEEKEQKVFVLEENQSLIQQEASTLRSSMRELEKSHLQAHRELQALRRQVKALDGENTLQRQEVKELQAQVCEEEQKEVEARGEVFLVKQSLLECEAGREAALNEIASLQRRIVELETMTSQSQEMIQDQELQQKHCERNYRDTISELEGVLEEVTGQMSGLAAQSNLAEAKVLDLERQLAQCNGRHQNLEQKLMGLYSVLQKTLSIDHIEISYKNECRKHSPTSWRNHLQAKGLDVDLISAALQDLQQQLKEAHRDRDQGEARLAHLSQQLKDVLNKHEHLSAELIQMQKTLNQSKKENQEAAMQLQEAHMSISQLKEEVISVERDKNGELSYIRVRLQAAETESQTLKDKLKVAQDSESLANADKRKLRASLEDAKKRVSHLELSQRTLEGESERARLRAAELVTEASALQERLVDMRRKLSVCEDQCATLRVSEERLTLSLARSEQQEFQLREQVHKLSSILDNNRTNTRALQEQVSQLEMALTLSQQDRKLMQDRLDKMREALAERKQLNYTLTDRNHCLQRALEDSEYKKCEVNGTLREGERQNHSPEVQAEMQ
ncbi:rootletin isoform X2 [Synchiropus splendidus]|uniref:rootletin isoform X2 n=1 Tax=Synchiropus splendidus TaxID=270530 RepID=UPI00237E1D04|nr:rootletin isoform X2 [Synchiropus splendidus]